MNSYITKVLKFYSLIENSLIITHIHFTQSLWQSQTGCMSQQSSSHWTDSGVLLVRVILLIKYSVFLFCGKARVTVVRVTLEAK